MDCGDTVEYEGVKRMILARMKAPCDHCDWFFMLSGLNYWVCESKCKEIGDE